MTELSQPQLQEITLDLEQLIEGLQSLLETTESGAKPVKLKDNQGRLSRMDEMHNQSILIANRTMATNRLKQAHAALHRLAGDAYGICETCDEAIVFARLKAYPDARMCIECQAEAE